MFKKNARNTVFALIMMVITGIAFTFLGIFAVDLLGSFSFVGVIALFCIILGIGYYVGRQLDYDKKTGLLSIVVLPMAILLAVYGIFMVLASVVSMILQYPAAVWFETFNISADSNAVMFYVVAFAHYLVYALAIFVGACKNKAK